MTLNEFEATSIVFGTSGDTRGSLTLYILSKEGDVYALCPFVPSTFVLTQQELEELFDSAISADYQNRSSDDDELATRKHYERQLN